MFQTELVVVRVDRKCRVVWFVEKDRLLARTIVVGQGGRAAGRSGESRSHYLGANRAGGHGTREALVHIDAIVLLWFTHLPTDPGQGITDDQRSWLAALQL